MTLRYLLCTTGLCLLGSSFLNYALIGTEKPTTAALPRLADQTPYVLVWSDEFNRPGPPDPGNWVLGEGFQRNHEDQWYQKDNCYCKNGYLIIEARKAHFKNPGYDSMSTDWRKSRKWVDYTSGIVTTRCKKSWEYGRFEIKAKIPASDGLWPAFWTLGIKGQWPSNGEMDIMEYYQRQLLANIATGTSKAYTPKWFSKKKLISQFSDTGWADRFHIWRMDWRPDSITLSVDHTMMLAVAMDSLSNPDGTNPFMQPHYLLLNLAIGGDNGGSPKLVDFPARYQIDYVRVYQKLK